MKIVKLHTINWTLFQQSYLYFRHFENYLLILFVSKLVQVMNKVYLRQFSKNRTKIVIMLWSVMGDPAQLYHERYFQRYSKMRKF